MKYSTHHKFVSEELREVHFDIQGEVRYVIGHLFRQSQEFAKLFDIVLDVPIRAVGVPDAK